jgi:predicted dehydrogenase
MPEMARIAVIGTGWWATYAHIPSLIEYPHAQLVALCDLNPKRLEAAAGIYHVEKTYTDAATMMEQEQLDGVVIATPHATHYPLIKLALEHNLHVVVEKPMVLFAEHARELIELAEARNLGLIVGYPWHYNPHIRHVRDLIASGELGNIQYVNCSFSSQIHHFLSGREESHIKHHYPVHGPGSVYANRELSGGGFGHLQVTHSAGVMFFTTGLRMRRVMAWMQNNGLTVDEVNSITVEFENGALGAVSGTGNGHQRKLDLIIHCEHGSVDIDLVANTASIRRFDQSLERLPDLNDEDIYPLYAPSRNLADLILGRAEVQSPAEVGLRTVELLDAAYRSAERDGVPVSRDELYS